MEEALMAPQAALQAVVLHTSLEVPKPQPRGGEEELLERQIPILPAHPLHLEAAGGAGQARRAPEHDGTRSVPRTVPVTHHSGLRQARESPAEGARGGARRGGGGVPELPELPGGDAGGGGQGGGSGQRRGAASPLEQLEVACFC